MATRPALSSLLRATATLVVAGLVVSAGAPSAVRAEDPTPGPTSVVFARPQYLVFMVSHGTYNGPVEDNAYWLYTSPPDGENNDHFAVPDGSGGSFHYTGRLVAGPFNDDTQLCPIMIDLGIDWLDTWPPGGYAQVVDCARFRPAGSPTPGGGASSASPGATATPGESPTPEPLLEGTQVFVGTVTDGWGHRLADLLVRLRAGDAEIETTTDAKGAYRFELVVDQTEGFDPRVDDVRLEAWTVDRTPDGSDRFRVRFDRGFAPRFVPAVVMTKPIRLTKETDQPLRIDLDFGVDDPVYDHATFPASLVPTNAQDDLALIYFHLHQAFELADRLGQTLDYMLPLDVETNLHQTADDGTLVPARGAFWIGNVSRYPEPVIDPWVGIGANEWTAWSPNRADNREWHEFGHHFLADAFGNALPGGTKEANHGGLYANSTSNDAWTEGFAEWYSTMVAKHVAGVPRPELYDYSGGTIDLEWDYRAGPRLFEEIALAGILLDLEDGPADYAAPRGGAKLVAPWSAETGWHGRRYLVGAVRNDGEKRARAVMVLAEFLDDSGKVLRRGYGAAVPWYLDPGETAAYAIPVPGALAYAGVRQVAFEARANTKGADDDQLDLTPEELWGTLVRASSDHPASNYHAYDAWDVYRAVRAAYPGDRDRDGLDDVDEIFINHGYFDDRNGDGKWQPGEQVGRSGYPAGIGHPGRSDRRDLEPPAAFQLRLRASDASGVRLAFDRARVRLLLDGGGADRSWETVVPVAEDGLVTLFPPPDGIAGRFEAVPLVDGRTPDDAVVLALDDVRALGSAALAGGSDPGLGEATVSFSPAGPPIDPATATEGDAAALLAALYRSGEPGTLRPPAEALPPSEHRAADASTEPAPVAVAYPRVGDRTVAIAGLAVGGVTFIVTFAALALLRRRRKGP